MPQISQWTGMTEHKDTSYQGQEATPWLWGSCTGGAGSLSPVYAQGPIFSTSAHGDDSFFCGTRSHVLFSSAVCSPPPWQRDPALWHRRRQSGSARGRWTSGSPRRVFPQTTCGPAEVTGRTCLLVERLAERETERGGTWGSAVAKRNGNPSFPTWPVFLSLFVFVYLLVFLAHRARDTHFARVALNLQLYRRHGDLACFGLAS